MQYLKEQARLGAWVNNDMCEIGALSENYENGIVTLVKMLNLVTLADLVKRVNLRKG